MTHKKITDLTELTSLADADLLHVIDDVVGTPTNKKILASNVSSYVLDNITADDIDGLVWPRSALEISNSITPTDYSYPWGDVRRFGAVADSALGVQGTDNATAFQNAVNSGHAVYVPEGYYSIESTVQIISDGSTQGGKTFIMTSNTRLERFGSSVEPILHVVGEQNYVDGNGGVLAVRAQGGYTKGLLLFGNDPSETDYTSTTSRISQYTILKNFKIIGKSANTGWDGSVGLFVESNGRFRGDFITPSHFNPYYASVENIHSTQWDFPFHLSTDSNAISFVGCSSIKFGHAAYSINGYGNQFTACKAESALAQDSTERFVWYFGKKDDPFGPEANHVACDSDAATIAITGISAANPAVVTCVGHGLATEDKCKIEDVVDSNPDGTLESAVNNGHFQVTKLTNDTFSIPIDTSALDTYASGGLMIASFYPILGARANQIDGYTETAYSATTTKVRLMGFGTPVVSYDVASSNTNWGRNILNVSGYATAGGVGTGGDSDWTAVGRNDVKTSDFRTERNAITDIHNFQFRELDDGSGNSFGTNEFRSFSGRMANLAESTPYNVITIDNVGPTTACMNLKLSFAGKESTNADVHAGEISWLLPVTGGSNQTAIKYKDFQANENDENVTWSITDAAGTDASTGKFTLVLTTGNPTSTGSFFYSWKVDLIPSELEGDTGLDWDDDVTIQNGA